LAFSTYFIVILAPISDIAQH